MRRSRVACALGALAWVVVLAAGVRGEEERPEAKLRKQLDAASEAFEQGRFEQARSQFEAATKQDPGSIRAWSGLGWSLWQLGRQDQALKVWNDVLKVSPKEPGILLALGQAYEKQGRWDQALGYYDRVLKLGENTKEAHLGRARVLIQNERWEAARDDLQQAIAKDPQDAAMQFELARVYLKLDRRSDAEVILRRLASRSPEPKYLRLLGDGMLTLERFDEAADYYRRALARDPDHRGTVLSLGRAYSRNHRFAEALDVLNGWVKRHPEDDQAREELAKDAENAEHYDEAATQYAYLQKEHPEDLKWSIALARLYRRRGEPDKATGLAREIVKRDPQNVDALGILADDALLADREEEAIRWLEDLRRIAPSTARLNQLGRLHISRGNYFDQRDQEERAQAEYKAAEEVLRASAQLDPTDSDAPLGWIAAKRLGNDSTGAISEGEKMLAGHPNLQALRRELFEAYSQAGDWENAERYLRQLQKEYPNNTGLEQQYALLEYNRGEREAGIERLETLLQKNLDERVPILLYHGIAGADRIPAALPVQNFRDQIMALKRAGYETITLKQFIDFANEKPVKLPKKPILITFDDARADSLRWSDPILKEVGYTAVMFIPTGEIGRHGPYYAPWRVLREAHDSGRWEMGCHAHLGHRKVAIDAEGHEGLFFADRQWLPDKGRAETEDEFRQRLDQDYQICREEIEKNIPGSHVVGYAYPFGDFGQRRFNNEPNAVKINLELVNKYYQAAFVEDPFGPATPATPHALFPRYEMPLDSKGVDLLRLLETNDPKKSTQYLLANLYTYSGNFARAGELYDTLEQEGFDHATLLAARAQALQWTGNFGGARDLYEEALRLDPDNARLAKRVESLNEQVAPRIDFGGQYYADNRDRSNFSLGPGGKVFLSDRWSIATTYQFREFRHDHIGLSDLLGAPPTTQAGGTTIGTPTTPGGAATAGGTPATGGTTTPSTRTTAALVNDPLGTGDLKVNGHQVEAQLEYQLDGNTGLALSGGVASFKNRSTPHAVDDPDTIPLAAGRLSLGLSDYGQVVLGGSHGFVPTAGTLLQNLTYDGGLGQLTIHPLETVTAFGQFGAERYDDGNRRVSGVARLTKLVWKEPNIELGYQFVYDDAQRNNPFFYTPNRFIANEGVFSLLFGDGKPLLFALAAAVGGGSERGGNVEAEGSVSSNVELRLGRHFRLNVGGGRSQSARFSSYEGRGSLSYRF